MGGDALKCVHDGAYFLCGNLGGRAAGLFASFLVVTDYRRRRLLRKMYNLQIAYLGYILGLRARIDTSSSTPLPRVGWLHWYAHG